MLPRHYIRQWMSIRHLSFVALAILGVPLLVSLSLSLRHVELLSQQAHSLVAQASDGSQLRKQLQQQLDTLERTSKQAVVLRDPQADQRVDSLLGEWHQWRLSQTIALPEFAELKQFQARFELAREQQQLPPLNDYFVSINNALLLWEQQQQQDLLLGASEFDLFRQQARKGILISLASLPLAAVVAFLLMWGTTRPLTLMQQQITKLKRHGLGQPIKVKGLCELVEIAEALDDMRLRLLQIEQQRSDYLRHLSHALKTPLAAIREGNALLSDDSIGSLSPQQRELTHILDDSSLRLQQLIERLLDFNHLLAAPRHREQRVNLAELVPKVLLNHRPSILSRGLIVEDLALEHELFSESESLQVIIDNLISNAVKFSPAGGCIQLSLVTEHGHWALRVDDQGPGIDELQQARVFEAFYQGDAVASASVKGSGLGLAIAGELAKRLGLVLSYQRLEQGSRFQLSGFEEAADVA